MFCFLSQIWYISHHGILQTFVSIPRSSSSRGAASLESMASATTEEELNKLLDQIEEEIGKDMELTQDLLDILNDEARLEQEEGCELEPMDEDEVNIIHYLSQL